jgi:methyl-accepting chemotaxis protein
MTLSGLMPKLKIKATIQVFGVAMAVGIGLAVLINAVSMSKIRIGGTTYDEIVQVKDLIADILPPPLYVIEGYLEAGLAYNRVKPVAESRNRIAQLRKEYDERRNYWIASGLDQAIKQKLTETSHSHALKFWKQIDGELLPALERRDDAAARKAYDDVTQSYQAHRKVIDEIVAQADMLQKASEAEAAQHGTIALWSIGIVDVILLMIPAFGIIMILRSVVAPVAQLTGVMGRMSAGNFEETIPSTKRHDEIGEMAKALVVFRDAAVEKTRLESQTREQQMQAEQERRRAADERAESERKAAREKAEQDRVAADERLARERAAAQEKAEADRQAAAERDAATAKLMNDFDAAVGGIVRAAMAGDFSQRVPLEGKDGVIRNLADALNTMCDNLGQAFDEVERMFGSLSKGDLTARITANYQGAFATLKNNANATAQRLLETVTEIKQAAHEVSNASAEIATSTSDLSQRTEEQAASLERTSAAMEEISVTVKKNAENAQQASQRASQTRDAADRGGQVVTSAVEAMARIDEASHKMADIISVIDEIARQTNLLALNAAVEAARAGEAGRGFAVVATEVRSLAQRSSQAAKDISELITNSSGQVKDGVELVNRAGTALNEIVESIKGVADIVVSIASASAEQSSGLDQVKEALAQMDEATQQNSALVEENAATAKTLADQSATMGEQMGFFRTEDGGRLRTSGQRAVAA